MQIVHVLFILLCLISSSHIFITLTGLHSATLCFFLWDFREIHISDLCDKIIKKTSHISRWQPLLEILLVSCNYFTVCFNEKIHEKTVFETKNVTRLDEEKIIYEGGISSYSCTSFLVYHDVYIYFLEILLVSFDYLTVCFNEKNSKKTL